MRRSVSQSKVWVALAVGIAVFAAIGLTAAFYLTRSEGDVSNKNVEFDSEPAPKPIDDRHVVDWPVYGYSNDQRRFFPSEDVRPPFRKRWALRGGVLLEFNPIVAGNSLYVLKNNARLVAISKRSGRIRWTQPLGALAASSPAYSEGRIFATVLERKRSNKKGRVVAVNPKNGRIIWSRPLQSRTESSPVVHGGLLFFGSEDGTVYALKTTSGRIVWKYKAKAAVKSGLALAEGKLYFGDYSGRFYSIRELSGRKVWSVHTKNAHFGLSSGQFYSTPAVANDRVFVGNTDGFVYSFAADDGELAWRKKTGGFVYSSPAVAQLDDLKPTVFVGSYDGWFYALDARSGKTRWKYNAKGRISGGATVIGDVVYFANLKARSTFGLDIRSGKKRFWINKGGFNPVASDGQTLFLTGFTSVFALSPRQSAATS